MGDASTIGIRARWWAQAAVFAAVGIANTAVDAVAFALLVQILGWSSGIEAVTASAIGFVAGAINSYAWNSRVTFSGHGQRDSARLAMQFAAVTLGGVAVTSAVFAAVEASGLPGGIVAAKAAAIGAGAAWNFLLLRRWVFAAA